MAEPWRTRIVDHGEEDPAGLIPHPQNWREHPQQQANALGQALDKVGWVQDVIVNRTTGHLVDGHLRAGLAVNRGMASIPVSYVELDAEEEKLVLASLDPLSSLAVDDEAALIGLLADIASSSEDFDGMVAWLRQGERVASPKPTQNQIDQQAEELARRFADGPDGTGIEVTCPECGEQFGLAGIGITS